MPLTGSGTETLSALTRDDIVRFHSTWFKPNNSTLIVVGDTTVAEINPKLQKLFGQWQAAPMPEKKFHKVPRPAKPKIYLIDKPGAQHSVVIAGTVAPSPDIKSEVALETMNNVFGGTFGARLNMTSAKTSIGRTERRRCFMLRGQSGRFLHTRQCRAIRLPILSPKC